MNCTILRCDANYCKLAGLFLPLWPRKNVIGAWQHFGRLLSDPLHNLMFATCSRSVTQLPHSQTPLGPFLIGKTSEPGHSRDMSAPIRKNVNDMTVLKKNPICQNPPTSHTYRMHSHNGKHVSLHSSTKRPKHPSTIYLSPLLDTHTSSLPRLEVWSIPIHVYPTSKWLPLPIFSFQKRVIF